MRAGAMPAGGQDARIADRVGDTADTPPPSACASGWIRGGAVRLLEHPAGKNGHVD